MTLKILRWIAGITVSVWIISVIFRLGGKFINILLIVSTVIFIYDAVFNLRKENKNKI